jgi:hypothetical protein
MILWFFISIVCICAGMGGASLAGYPLYWGLLAGWVCPAVVLMLVLLPGVVIGKIGMEVRRRRENPPLIPWREHRELKA